MLYESEGYPEARVKWMSNNNTNMTHETVQLQQNNGSGLYTLKSLLVVDLNSDTDFTFILQNDMLNQTIERNVSVARDYENDTSKSSSKSKMCIISFFLFIIVIVILCLIIYWLLHQLKLFKQKREEENKVL